MVIWSDTDPLVVGQRALIRVLDRYSQWHRNVPVLVLATATSDDYLAYCAEEGVTVSHPPKPTDYYYRVSVD